MHMDEARSLKDRSEGVGSALEPRALTALGVEFGSLHYKIYPWIIQSKTCITYMQRAALRARSRRWPETLEQINSRETHILRQEIIYLTYKYIVM
jgi:hypothetical protein